MKKVILLIAILLCSPLVFSAGKNKKEPLPMPTAELLEKGFEVGDVNNRIRTSQVSQWKRLNSQYVLVEGKSKKNSSLIKFKRKCARSKSATFVYNVHGSTLTNLDVISVVDYPIGIRKVCIIDEIYKLNLVEKK